MIKEELKKAARETIDITERGYYDNGSTRIELPKADYGKAEVFDKEKLENILQNKEELFERADKSEDHVIYIENKDSFEAVRKGQRPLVMNFASARHPGGGFLNGAKAQEEALCRASTLYKSLSSDTAAEMYEYNNTHKNPFYSDYMILTPEVCVFRDRYGKLLSEPFMVSVWTIPAPNKNGPARAESQKSIDSVMEKRLKYFFAAAAERGYDRLVLGAWGCGAFGHDARDVAGYFKRLLIDKGYIELFKTVNFAILDTPEQYKVKAFINVFGGKTIKYKE